MQYWGMTLTNRFHFAVRLSSNRSQMKSKCGNNKKVAHEAMAECVTDVLATFWRLLGSITKQTHGIMESIRFIKQPQKKLFYFKIFQHDSKAGPLWQTRKKAIWRNLLSIHVKQSHWLLWVAKEFWLVQENYATVKLDSSVAPRRLKIYSESRIELRNLQILKKMLENRDSFCHQSSSVSWIAWTLPWISQELKK